jgi:hypothetical protein
MVMSSDMVRNYGNVRLSIVGNLAPYSERVTFCNLFYAWESTLFAVALFPLSPTPSNLEKSNIAVCHLEGPA